MRHFTRLLITALVLSSLGGCAAMKPRDLVVGDSVRVEPAGEPAGFGRVALDYLKVPSYDVVSSLGAFASPTEPPRRLTAIECACLAAWESQIAAALEKEAASLRQESSKRHHGKGSSRLTPEILDDQAREERNDRAGEAVEAYFRLAEVQLQESVRRESDRELSAMSETLRRLHEIGLDGAIDSTELDRRRANLVLQGVQLRFNEARLTGQVKTLIGADPMSTWQIETECAIEPRGPEFELVDALAIGRQNDSQLSALRKLKNSNRPEDMELARKLMSVVSPLAGQEQSRCWLLTLLSASCGENNARNRRESGLRRSQMSELHDARQQQLDLEIAAAVVNIRQQLVQVGIAKDVQESWAERVAVLESHRELQKSGYLDVINAKSELLKAKSALYHELILLEIAHVKLRTAIGWYGQQCMTPGMQPGDAPCLPGPGLAEGAMSRDRFRY